MALTYYENLRSDYFRLTGEINRLSEKGKMFARVIANRKKQLEQVTKELKRYELYAQREKDGWQ